MSVPPLTYFPARERVAHAWKNGQGSTTEVARFPAGKGFADFEWRVSCAEFDRDCDFSEFLGVDRQLIVLSGAIELAVADRASALLDASSAVHVFPGDVPTRARVVKAPVVDLNVMTRRGRVLATVRRFDVVTGGSWVARADAVLLYLVNGSMDLQVADHAAQLAAADAVAIATGATVNVRAASPGASAVLVSFESSALRA